MISCQSQGKDLYSVLVLTENDQASIFVARSGEIIFKEKVIPEGTEAESSGSLGEQSYLRIDYEDGKSGLLKFCENGKEVEVNFDYDECSEASLKWPGKESSKYIPDLKCN